MHQKSLGSLLIAPLLQPQFATGVTTVTEYFQTETELNTQSTTKVI